MVPLRWVPDAPRSGPMVPLKAALRYPSEQAYGTPLVGPIVSLRVVSSISTILVLLQALILLYCYYISINAVLWYSSRRCYGTPREGPVVPFWWVLWSPRNGPLVSHEKVLWYP